jgi:hypothetical protein
LSESGCQQTHGQKTADALDKEGSAFITSGKNAGLEWRLEKHLL